MPATILQRGMVRLRRGSRFTKGAQAVVVATSDRNLVSGRLLTYANGTRGKTGNQFGLASPLRYNGVMYTETLPAIGTQTLIHVWVGTLISRGSNGDGGRSAGFLIGSSTNDVGVASKGQWDGYNWQDQWGALWDWNGQGDSGKIVPSGENFPIGKPSVVVTIRRGTTIEMWRDGVLILSVIKDLRSYTSSAMVVGGFIDNNYWWSNTDTVLAARLLADWSPKEVRAFSADPIGWMIEPVPGFNFAQLADGASRQGNMRGYNNEGVWRERMAIAQGYFNNSTSSGVEELVARGYFVDGAGFELPTANN